MGTCSLGNCCVCTKPITNARQVLWIFLCFFFLSLTKHEVPAKHKCNDRRGRPKEGRCLAAAVWDAFSRFSSENSQRQQLGKASTTRAAAAAASAAGTVAIVATIATAPRFGTTAATGWKRWTTLFQTLWRDAEVRFTSRSLRSNNSGVQRQNAAAVRRGGSREE
jgi:hypothetical protein